jgi:methionyl-tRNA formyltransferase
MDKGHRIIFMGTPAFAVASLNALVEAGFTVAAVVTAPDRPAGRGLRDRPSAVKQRALELGLPVLQPEKLRDPAFLAALDAYAADLYTVVAFRMLPEVLWRRPRLGTVNLHASLLPDLRGAAPINHALMLGYTTTGVTTFLIGGTIDTGDILQREEVPVGPDETAGELHDRLMTIGARLLVRTANALFAGTARAVPQEAVGTGGGLHNAPKLTPATCRIDWRREGQCVHDHVRGLSPYPGAWTKRVDADGNESHFKVLRTKPCTDPTVALAPGAVQMDGERLLVGCGDGAIELLQVQPEGKRPMSAAELVRGARDLRSSFFR